MSTCYEIYQPVLTFCSRDENEKRTTISMTPRTGNNKTLEDGRPSSGDPPLLTVPTNIPDDETSTMARNSSKDATATTLLLHKTLVAVQQDTTRFFDTQDKDDNNKALTKTEHATDSTTTTSTNDDDAVHVLNYAKADLTDPTRLQELLQALALESTTSTSVSSSLHVDLQGATFSGPEDFARVLAALQDCPQLVRANLSNYLCCDYLSSAPQNPLQEQEEQEQQEHEPAKALESFLIHAPRLQSLDLSGHLFKNPSLVQELCRGLQHTRAPLQELYLHSCLLSESSAQRILDSALVQDTLQVLDLGANDQFGPNLLTNHVAPYLQQTQSLKALILDHSSAMFAGTSTVKDLQPFWQALSDNTTLQRLSLRYCRLTHAMGHALLRAVASGSNQTLRELDLEFTGFGLRDTGNETLIQLIPHMTAMRTLKLYTVYPTPLIPSLLQALHSNTSLQSFRPRLVVGSKSSGGNHHHKTNISMPCRRTSHPLRAEQAIRTILQRNQTVETSLSLLVASSVAPALLPRALAQLQATAPAASYAVLQQWLPEACLVENI